MFICESPLSAKLSTCIVSCHVYPKHNISKVVNIPYPVLADETTAVRADTAEFRVSILASLSFRSPIFRLPVIFILGGLFGHTPSTGSLAVPKQIEKKSCQHQILKPSHRHMSNTQHLQRGTTAKGEALLAGPAVPHGLVSHLEKSEARKRPE